MRKKLFRPPGDPGGGTEQEFWVSLTDPRSRSAGPHHNQLLVLGFRAYYRALEEPPGEQRSQHILTGNCLLALHEQRLLSLAISVGLRSWLRTLTTPWATLETRHHWRHRDPGPLRLRLEDAWIGLATRLLIGVDLPIGLVKTGKPVPPGDKPLAVQRVPVDAGDGRHRIEDLSDEVLLGKLFTHLGVDGGRARCWNDLRDRMAYISALFAEHQRAAWWFDEAGSVVRVPPRPGLDSVLRSQLRLLAGPVPIDGSARRRGEVASPLTDDQLDVLRTRATHLPLEGPEQLRLEDVADEGNTARIHLIREDVEQRRSQAVQPGDLLDPATCTRARKVFDRWSTVWFMALVFRSLPDSYAAAAGVHVLGRVSDLATDPFRRAGETAFFVMDLLGSDKGWHEGAMQPDGAALQSVRGVRAMHALMADRLLNHQWDSAVYGVPFNQEDVIGTALSFSTSTLDMLDELGIETDEQTRNAVVRFWLGIGFLLGAPHDALMVPGPEGTLRPLDHREARALSLAIRRRHHARSVDGVRLCEALIEGVSDGFPREFGWLTPGLMQVLGEPRATALLLTGTGEGRTGARLIAAVLGGLLRIRPLRPLTRTVIQAIGQRWVRPFLAQGRTRPYRRPLSPDDVTRLESAARVPDRWPEGCAGRRAHAAPPGPTGPPPVAQPGRRPRRLARIARRR